MRLESKLKSNCSVLYTRLSTLKFKLYPTANWKLLEVLKEGSDVIMWVFQKEKEIGGGHRGYLENIAVELMREDKGH